MQKRFFTAPHLKAHTARRTAHSYSTNGAGSRESLPMPPEAASEQRERLQYNAAHLLKLTAHGPRPIATAQMVQEAARGKCAVSRLPSHVCPSHVYRHLCCTKPLTLISYFFSVPFLWYNTLKLYRLFILRFATKEGSYSEFRNGKISVSVWRNIEYE